ncbi:hypothetical protein G9A89_000219 [Geosiphon pyriformis]|nr:hypothetical protein G9A89_000219 [Geosiphon pyriformis]
MCVQIWEEEPSSQGNANSSNNCCQNKFSRRLSTASLLTDRCNPSAATTIDVLARLACVDSRRASSCVRHRCCRYLRNGHALVGVPYASWTPAVCDSHLPFTIHHSRHHTLSGNLAIPALRQGLEWRIMAETATATATARWISMICLKIVLALSSKNGTIDEDTNHGGTNQEQDVGKWYYSIISRLNTLKILPCGGSFSYKYSCAAGKAFAGAFPAAHEYMYSNDPPQDKDSVQYWIWGDDKESLKSLHSQLKTTVDLLESLREELDAIIRGDGGEPLESLRQELKAMEDELGNLNRTLDAPVLFPIPNMGSEHIPANVLERIRRFEERELERLEALIKKSKALIQEREAHIETKQQHINERETVIEKTMQHINEREGRIQERFARILAKHATIKTVLVAFSGKGNESTGTALRTATLNLKRFEKSAACQPSPVKVEEILCSQSEKKFLTKLLDKEILQDNKNQLTKLQTFVAKIIEHCDDAKVHPRTKDVKLNRSVNKILTWTTATRVTPSVLQKHYARPPLQGGETTADQPMLYALIYKILTIISSDSVSLSSEQFVVSIVPSERKRGRKIDLTVEEYREFLHVRFPEMLGRVIEVKSTSDDADGFRKNQHRAREQVLGHLARQLLCAFDFGGIGQDAVVPGIVLSKFLK